mmetsp:Transcript_851/g.1280  ORF Transcript_851/g.1280 Transcript_851/m.1280 type:complete len:110 (-) Transcript_851:698-1027(-)
MYFSKANFKTGHLQGLEHQTITTCILVKRTFRTVLHLIILRSPFYFRQISLQNLANYHQKNYLFFFFFPDFFFFFRLSFSSSSALIFPAAASDSASSCRFLHSANNRVP